MKDPSPKNCARDRRQIASFTRLQAICSAAVCKIRSLIRLAEGRLQVSLPILMKIVMSTCDHLLVSVFRHVGFTWSVDNQQKGT